jgi:hypothetical protein
MLVLLLIIVSLLFLLTIIRFVKKVIEIISKRKSRIEFPLDSEIEKFLNNDSFGKWVNVDNYYYNDMRRLMFHIHNNEIQMTRDYYVHTISNPGIYFKVSKENFIKVVKA